MKSVRFCLTCSASMLTRCLSLSFCISISRSLVSLAVVGCTLVLFVLRRYLTHIPGISKVNSFREAPCDVHVLVYFNGECLLRFFTRSVSGFFFTFFPLISIQPCVGLCISYMTEVCVSSAWRICECHAFAVFSLVVFHFAC